MAANMDLSKIFNVQNLDNRDYIIIGLIVLLFSLLFFRKKREHFVTDNQECGKPITKGNLVVRVADDTKCSDDLKPYCEYGPTFLDNKPSFHCSKYNCTSDDECKIPEKGGPNTPYPYCVKNPGSNNGFCGDLNNLKRTLYPSSFPAGSMNR
jgi:LPXTG-motif cell wall-anchored protein